MPEVQGSSSATHSTGGALTDLTFAEVARVNRLRCERWNPGFPDDGWTGADWSNALAGEAGEACMW